MKTRLFAIGGVILALVCLNLAFSKSALADSPAANQAAIDVTIHDNGGISIGGIDLSMLGAQPLAPQAILIAKDLDHVQATANNDTVTISVQDTPVAQVLWNATTRDTAAKLAAHYGVQITPDMQARLEQWISSSNVDFTARYTNDLSKPLSVNITKPLQMSIASNGQLTFEAIPLAAAITPEALATIQQGGNQATACWSKGTLTAKVDGADLPSITLNPDGVNLVTKALNLPVEPAVTTEVLSSTLGIDLSLPNGTHATNATCGTTN